MIEIMGLSRSFNGVKAVDDVSLSIAGGEIFGLLGPNGAGKTTTLRMLACLIAPTGGTALIDGLDIRKKNEATKIRRKIGFLTESPGLYETLSAYRNLDFYGKIFGVNEPVRRERIEHYLKLMGIWEKCDESVGGFSKGMKQKIAIARCLVHDPDILYLDEATSGLDPEMARTIRELVFELKREGKTIVYSTHNTDEADHMCDRIGIIRGKLVRVDAPGMLKRDIGERRAVVQLKEIMPDLLKKIRALDYVIRLSVDGNKLTFEMSAREQDNAILVRDLVEMGADVQFVRDEARSLEDAYLKITGAAR